VDKKAAEENFVAFFRKNRFYRNGVEKDARGRPLRGSCGLWKNRLSGSF
jgi:hypothetical protein